MNEIAPERLLVSRETRERKTVVRVGSVPIGDGNPVIIAGPCSVESQDQILACAQEVAKRGGHLLRGGCFKPRTSPYSFQGLGLPGIRLLAEAGRASGLMVEIHPAPERALSDGPQALTFDDFADLTRRLAAPLLPQTRRQTRRVPSHS
ncbi:MAG: hypothetical protein ACRD2Z_11675 [Thermoanaerobaculia bacterium]